MQFPINPNFSSGDTLKGEFALPYFPAKEICSFAQTNPAANTHQQQIREWVFHFSGTRGSFSAIGNGFFVRKRRKRTMRWRKFNTVRAIRRDRGTEKKDAREFFLKKNREKKVQYCCTLIDRRQFVAASILLRPKKVRYGGGKLEQRQPETASHFIRTDDRPPPNLKVAVMKKR